MNQNVTRLALCAFAIALNVVAGTIVGDLKIPLLFLDTIGTIFIAVLYGPYWAFAVGILTNLVLGVTSNYTNIPFGLVNGAVGLIAGYAARRYGFSLWIAIASGVFMSIICPIIGTPIAVAMFGGLTGGATDVVVIWLRDAGAQLFAAAFIPRLYENLLDKVLSCILVMLIIRNLPAGMMKRLGSPKRSSRGSQHAA
ncbi:CD3073 family putative ECF transporter S component [Cohnella candidum]|uniref:CD3073 family putative ECF transporter S component n=1 Tax=Cohnella candidum TaxID=2674991 RepID=UPI001F14EB5E|nr:CD3073 family putative ECF transporter S component [Cohnella candidum]